MWSDCYSRMTPASLCRLSQSKVQTICEVSTVSTFVVCTFLKLSTRRYKSHTMFQRFRHLTFVLSRPDRLKSTNDLRSFNSSSTCLVYFADTAVTKVQMIYEASRGPALAVCTLAFAALLHGANTRRMPVHAPRQLPICQNFLLTTAF